MRSGVFFTTFRMGPFALGNFLHLLSLGKFVESLPNYILEGTQKTT